MNPCDDKVYTYLIVNNSLDCVVYVGKSKNPKQRWAVHKTNSKGIGKPNERFLVYNIHRHIAEYGVENFSMIVVADYNCEAQLQEYYRPMCCMKYEKI